MKPRDLDLINQLVLKTIESLDKSNNDIERTCWMVLHEHHHGLMPFEYDVREIDEALYLSVLNEIKERLNQGGHFVIGELGFGVGLNFLLTWKLFNQISKDFAGN